MARRCRNQRFRGVASDLDRALPGPPTSKLKFVGFPVLITFHTMDGACDITSSLDTCASPKLRELTTDSTNNPRVHRERRIARSTPRPPQQRRAFLSPIA